MKEKVSIQHNLLVIYVLVFIFTLHYAISTYINSSFLGSVSPERFVGIIYSFTALMALIAFYKAPKMLHKYGNYRMTSFLLFVKLASLIVLVLSTNMWAVLIAYIIGSVSATIIGFNLDVFVKSFSDDKKTGKIRGIFLTVSNTAFLISPLITSFILKNGDYWKIYLTSAAILCPVIFLLREHLRNFKDPVYESIKIKETLRHIYQHKNIFYVSIAAVLIQFFYAWMVIYTPIYLHEYLKFSWENIGIVLSFMLVPFVIMEIPLGKIADKWLGEKELMTIGFILMGISTGLLFFMDKSSIFMWALMLFITRIGASTVEAMTDIYFFKNVKCLNINFIDIYRSTYPLAFIFAPLIASFFLIFLDIKFLFLILGIIMLYASSISLKIVDTN